MGLFVADFIFMRKFYKPCFKDAVFQISEYLECQFMRRSFKIHQILPLLGASPLIYANLNPHSLKILATKFGRNQCSGFREEVI